MKQRHSASNAIPTRYRGYHFRSRLEARWAVFFDSCRIKWQYEPEGYDLTDYGLAIDRPGVGLYLPDFWLPKTETWVEIKGVLPANHFFDMDEELRMAALLDETRAKLGFVFWGMPDVDTMATMVHWDTGDQIHSEISRIPDGICCFHGVSDKAVSAAKSARFEHGHSGRS